MRCKSVRLKSIRLILRFLFPREKGKLQSIYIFENVKVMIIPSTSFVLHPTHNATYLTDIPFQSQSEQSLTQWTIAPNLNRISTVHSR